MREHYHSGDQVLQAAWDVEKEAIAVTLGQQHEFAVDLRAEDGDSVIAIKRSTTMTEGIADCRGMTSICLYGEGVVTVSPVDEGEEWYAITLVALEPKTICARRIGLTGTGKLVING